jgi:hypothetical protein
VTNQQTRAEPSYTSARPTLGSPRVTAEEARSSCRSARHKQEDSDSSPVRPRGLLDRRPITALANCAYTRTVGHGYVPMSAASTAHRLLPPAALSSPSAGIDRQGVAFKREQHGRTHQSRSISCTGSYHGDNN